MKRFALGSLVLALAAASTAQAQYYDDRGYGYDDRGYGYDDGGYRYQDSGYGQDGAHYDIARVLSVDPIVERGAQPVQRQECWNEPAPTYAYDDRYDDRYGDRYGDRRYGQPRTSGGGAVVGAIVGGALGNTVGHGDDRRVATVLGAVIGGAIGNDVERNNIRRQDAYYGRDARYYERYVAQQDVRRCRVVADYRPEERVAGYRVTYEYGGRTYETVTDYHPGNELRVLVAVTPEN